MVDWVTIYPKGKRPFKAAERVQEKLAELTKGEAEIYQFAFEEEKEVTDRALKLAAISKPKSNWGLQESWGLAALIMDSWKGDNQYEKPGIIRKKHLVLFGSAGKLF